MGHRPFRDKRITTHVALVARAFGASGIYIDSKDVALEETLSKIVSKFGGNFRIESGVDWKKKFREFKGVKIHLTMYGESIESLKDKLKSELISKDSIILVGASKVPPDAYEISDYNVSVTNQPHSEVSALAITLDRLLEGKEFDSEVRTGINVIPNPRGKTVEYIPSEEDISRIYAEAKLPQNIADHSRAVAGLATRIAELCGANIDVVRAASLLHDIGRSESNGIDHGIVGSRILKLYGVSERILQIVKRHVGAGISQDEAVKLGLPDHDLMPRTIEEKIVAQADNLFRGTFRLKMQQVTEIYEKRNLHEASERIKNLHKELSLLAGQDLDLITTE